MRRARRLPQRLVRAISLCVCLALVLTSLTIIPGSLVIGRSSTLPQERRDQDSSGKARKVKAEPARTGAPAATMPNLDEAKRKHDPVPEVRAPISSTIRSKRKPPESQRGRKVGESPAPRGSASLKEVDVTSGRRVSAVRSHHARASRSVNTMPPPPPSSANVALAANGGVTSASSTYSAAYPTSEMNDGDRKGLLVGNNGCWADATVGAFPDWVQVDFNGSKTINEIDFFSLQDNYMNPVEPTEAMTFSTYGLTAYAVQYWNGSGWVTVTGGSIVGNNKVWRKVTFAPVTTSKIRVVINQAASPYSYVTEIEAYEVPPPPPSVNVALPTSGGVTSASSTYSGAYPTSEMNDGDRKGLLVGNDGCWADATVGAFPDWVQVDFNGSKTINEVDFFSLQDNYLNPVEPTETQTFTTYGNQDFDVQYWTGTAWATVPDGSVVGNNKVWRKVTFAPVTTSKIRVVINQAASPYSYVTELEAWTDGGGVSPTSDLALARIDPFNQPGNQLLARDAAWNVPLVSLPGRAGLDLGLGLSYSSLVWTPAGDSIYFDEDHGTPSPGFRLGFPTVQGVFFDSQAGVNARLLITSGGRRIELRQVGSSNVYEAADSSYLQLIDYGSSLLVRSTDGTQMSYTQFGGDWHCNQIKDRNGNLISVNYNGQGDITNVTDTLGRVINFNYDSNANLISITQTWNGQTHNWATFGWSTHTMSLGFSGASVVGTFHGEAMPVLTQVGLDDGSYFTFQYTGAGQVNLIRRYTSDNVQRSYTAYDYASTTNDCPRILQTRTWAENWTGINGVPSEVVTQYSGELGDAWRQLVAPDGTVYKEFYGTGWQKGLTTQTEVWSDGVRQKWTTAAWTQDNTGVNYQTNPRVIETNVYDPAGNRNRSTVSYTSFALPSGVSCNLPSDAYQYAADAATVLRRSHTDYNLSATYLGRRIIGLATSQKLYDGANNLKSRTDVMYDEAGSVQNQGATTQHDDTNYGSGFVAGRANVSSARRYNVNNTSQYLSSGVRYNTAGAPVSTTDPLNHQTSISYTDSFSDSVNRNTFAYPTTVTDAAGFSSTLQYNYDFGAKTRTQGPPPAGQSQGVIQTIAYDSAARVQQVTTTNNGAYQRYVYGPNYVQSFGSVNSIADDAYAIQVFDGAGRVIGAANYHPGSAGGFSMVNTIYDLMGRAVKQSNPSEINSSWVPYGDDAGGVLYTQQSYDWKGRPLVTTNTDGTQKYASYGGCGCAGGEVVTLTDEVGRQQKVYSDVLGRTAKAEVLNWNGSVYSTTSNTYNARDQVTLVRQYQGAEGSGVYQDTNMSYDGYGRLLTRHVPEQNAGTATTYAYNTDDTVQSVTDARGAVATYSYNARHLATAITYGAPAGITPTSNVSFSYDAMGNRTSMTDGVGSVSYSYNQLSKMTSETRTMIGVGNYTIGYDYNLAGQLKSVTDPAGVTVNYGFDGAGRLNGVTGSSFGGVTTYASDLQYRAWGGLKHLAYGNSRTVDAAYNPRLQTSIFAIPGVMSKTYDYFADGRLRFSSEALNHKYDRSYGFDHAARMTQAFSGAEARGEPATNDRPYKQTFAYDGFSHLANRNSSVWSDFYSITDSYANNRRTDWDYDASGNLLGTGEITYTYDAAGSIGTVGTYDPQSTTTRTMDGEGQQVKTVESTYNESSQSWITTTTYYVRSTVLGGKVLTELNESGAKHRTFVYAGNQVLATQEIVPYYGTQGVTWEHRDPSNASYRTAYVTGDLSEYKELDPTGADVTHAPLIFPDPPYEDGSLLPYPSFSSPARPGVSYAVNGIPVTTDYFMQQIGIASQGSGFWLVESGARASQRVVGYRNSGVSWGRPFDATYDANGHMTSMDMGAVDSDLAGVNYGNISAVYDNSWSLLSLLPQRPRRRRGKRARAKKPPADPRSACAKFADELGNRLYNAVVLEGGYNPDSRHDLANAMNRQARTEPPVDLYGVPYGKRTYPIDGFKRELTANDQLADVYRHILFTAGNSLHGTPAADAENAVFRLYDWQQSVRGRAESDTELLDDDAGMAVGDLMLKTALAGKSGDYDGLKTRIRGILCDH